MADVRCPKCGSRTAIRTAKKDDSQYHVCINSPRCRGRVLVDEDQDGGLGDDWDKARPVSKTTHDSTRQRREPSSPEREVEKTIRIAKKDERKVRAGADHHDRKGRVPIDKTWGDDWEDDWGDDWDKDIPAKKTAKDSPPQRKASASPERGAETTIRTAKKDERRGNVGVDRPERKGKVPVDKGWGDDWDKEIPAPKPAPDRARRHVAPKPEIAPEKKESPRPRTQTVHKEGEHPEPLQQIAPKADTATEKKESPKLRQRRVPQRYLAPQKKKRSTVVIVIALVIAFLAIDGMIYAAFVLR